MISLSNNSWMMMPIKYFILSPFNNQNTILIVWMNFLQSHVLFHFLLIFQTNSTLQDFDSVLVNGITCVIIVGRVPLVYLMEGLRMHGSYSCCWWSVCWELRVITVSRSLAYFEMSQKCLCVCVRMHVRMYICMNMCVNLVISEAI